jgi:hypothetical protein
MDVKRKLTLLQFVSREMSPISVSSAQELLNNIARDIIAAKIKGHDEQQTLAYGQIAEYDFIGALFLSEHYLNLFDIRHSELYA